VYQWKKWSFQIHMYVTPTCKRTSGSYSAHSLTNFSSHANNLLSQSHTSSFDSHPKENISATVDNLLTSRSNNLTYLTSKDAPSNHGSFQNKVEVSYPTCLIILTKGHQNWSFLRSPPIDSPKISKILCTNIRKFWEFVTNFKISILM